MARTILIVATLLSLLFPRAALAQEAPARAPRAGIGVSFDPTLVSLVPLADAIGAPPVMLLVPIQLTERFRLEPSFGTLTAKTGREERSSGGVTPMLRTSSVSAGLAALGVWPVAPGVRANAGARFEFIHCDGDFALSGMASDTPTTHAAQSVTVVSGVLGAEYLPTPWFSIGLDLRLSYASLGAYEVRFRNTLPETTVKHGATSTTSTGAALVLRAFLF